MASKHHGFLFHVSDEDQIKAYLEKLRKEHHTANHVCYAWRLGWNKNRFRSSDDGEPSGTAGKPIFGQIQSHDLTNVLIAVVRYFGGTKLGTGGLIDAYRTAAAMAIEANSIVEIPVRDHYQLHFHYEQMPLVMKTVKDIQAERLSQEMNAQCKLEILVHEERSIRFQQVLTDAKIDWELLGRY